MKNDPDDNKIIECALEGKADYIITQDKHLLDLKFDKIKILTPREFLRRIK
ncbi:MAG: putative toxin-antitoxin system toxin component, PIN family [Nanoarchaeota archaeon]|nr:putative toxin-antitoxin system toxin component, PIN family [Nanoarchaeota archaeon]MBU1322366.1 putative toxin-antitoxin system toxin component, PIN family [Nanoarchaeota archaeon]MBU1598393.1 putative toxin-antitoxin system toxin component, PIN family [Nanoarchaeota archaeon]MBU2440770.1 putative toxin-antitoxin system toxin component, PIN family [Nanoarchaeota archaeon]